MLTTWQHQWWQLYNNNYIIIYLSTRRFTPPKKHNLTGRFKLRQQSLPVWSSRRVETSSRSLKLEFTRLASQAERYAIVKRMSNFMLCSLVSTTNRLNVPWEGAFGFWTKKNAKAVQKPEFSLSMPESCCCQYMSISHHRSPYLILHGRWPSGPPASCHTSDRGRRCGSKDTRCWRGASSIESRHGMMSLTHENLTTWALKLIAMRYTKYTYTCTDMMT